ncbi:MAG: hypothetical protein HYZ84_02145 [Candidatus Omnitrophica bacterium]|nr:hypothetical protein [Candidatus Omnitrophota bacterium]
MTSNQKVIEAFVVLPLVSAVREAIIKATIQKESMRAFESGEGKDPVLVILGLINRYLTNKAMIEATAKDFGVQPIFVWQPCPAYQYDSNYNLFKDSLFAYKMIMMKSAYGLVETLQQKRPLSNFIDLAGMQQDKKEPLYLDAFHYTAKMSKEVAEKIAQGMKEKNLLQVSLTKPQVGRAEEVLAAA